jgi:hypothetical protein
LVGGAFFYVLCFIAPFFYFFNIFNKLQKFRLSSGGRLGKLLGGEFFGHGVVVASFRGPSRGGWATFYRSKWPRSQKIGLTEFSGFQGELTRISCGLSPDPVRLQYSGISG